MALVQDLGGPKIRIGDFYKESVILKEGQTFILTTEKIIGDEKRVYVNYAPLPKEGKSGRTDNASRRKKETGNNKHQGERGCLQKS